MKSISAFLAMIMIFSCLNAFPLSVNASTEKFYEGFSELTTEELALLTADKTKYDVTVMIRFSYADMDMSGVSNYEKSARNEGLKEYYLSRNEKISHRLKLKECTVSAYSPFAEIVYDSLEEYGQNKGNLQKAARKKDVARIDVSVTSFSPQDCITTNDDPNYPWEYVLQDINMEVIYMLTLIIKRAVLLLMAE